MGFPSAGRFGAEAIISSLGVPVTSTPVTVYLTGTLTVATLYTDHTAATTTTNPISTDGLGNLTFYAAPGVYDLAFTVGGVATVQTVVVDPYPSDLAICPRFVPQGSPIYGTVPSNPQWVMLGGSVTASVASGIARVAFSPNFGHAVQVILPASGDGSGGPCADVALQPSGVDTTGFNVYCYEASGTVVPNGTSNVRIAFTAIGC